MPRAIFAVPARPSIELELAITPQEHVRGLSCRRTLPAGRGMMFLYDHAQYPSVWMKDTHFPLDVIFLAGGRVVDFRERLTPRSLATVTSSYPADSMIEVRAGFVRGYDIGCGTLVFVVM